jgi:hypothetical protein
MRRTSELLRERQDVVFVERFTGVTETGERFEKLAPICLAVHFAKDAGTLLS